VQPIAEWLVKIGLERYAPALADNDIDVSVLPHLTDADLEKIGVSLGHRRRCWLPLQSFPIPPKHLSNPR
jgi:hypothetical protein